MATGPNKVQKSVLLLTAFLLCLALEQQAQGEPLVCCPNKVARATYKACLFFKPYYFDECALAAFCKYYVIPSATCPHDYPSLDRHPAAGGEGDDAQVQFCRLGCTSALCEGSINARKTLEEERCSDACYRLCANKNASDDDTAAAAAAS